jgi:hypothetical protein
MKNSKKKGPKITNKFFQDMDIDSK